MASEIKAYSTQYDFLTCADRYRLFIGGRGAGKTFVGALAALQEAKPGEVGLVVAPTYSLLKTVAFDKLLKLGRSINAIAAFNRSDMIIDLRNGARVIGRSADNPDRLRGINASWLWMDEGRDMTRETWLIAIATLREGSGRAWVTSTPHGYDWMYDVFVTGQAGRVFQATMADNPHLPAEFIAAMRGEYGEGTAFAQQELNGAFVQLGGGLFDASKIAIVDTPPDIRSMVRFYDLAVTVKQTSDYTAGVKLGVTTDNTFVVLHVDRDKLSLPDMLNRIKQNAGLDGTACAIQLEAEKAGIIGLDFLMRDSAMNGYNLQTVVPVGDKYTRAAPVASRVNAGRFVMVRGAWNRAFLDELSVFPEGGHDDQVDALSGAYKALYFSGVPLFSTVDHDTPVYEVDTWN